MNSAVPTREPDRHADDQAYGLMQSAVSLISEGRWKEASHSLAQAAALHASADRPYDEARCLQLAATLQRSAGDTARARELARGAVQNKPPDSQLALSIEAERAETEFAESRYEAAVVHLTSAIGRARQAQLKPEGLSALLRRRGAANIALSRISEADMDFAEAARLLAAGDQNELPAFVRLEQAELLLNDGYAREADPVIATLAQTLPQAASPHLSAEMLAVQSHLARAAGRVREAADLAASARKHALQAVAPLSYFKASVSLAESLQELNELERAYGIYATTWVTLSDVVGKDVARSWVEPCLLVFQMRWGTEAFEQAKRGYEERRRQAMRSP